VELVSLLGMVAGFGASMYGFGGLVADWAREVAARLPRAEPPAVLVAITITRATRGRCPVCAQAIRGPAVECPGCRVHAHEDCWTYQGGCGIFACERRATSSPR
jgi:hypothetical protein